MRTVHSYALMMFQAWWPKLTEGIHGVSGWEYVLVTSYLIECAKNGFILPSERRQMVLMEKLDSMYPAAMFQHRKHLFHSALTELGEERTAVIVKKIRDEMVNVAREHNLVWVGVSYTPLDVVRCRYQVNFAATSRGVA